MDFEVILTSNFLKKSYFRRLFRSWWKLLIAFVLILFSVILDLRSGTFDQVSTIGLTAMGICIIIYSAVWCKHQKYIKEFTSKQGDAPVAYRLTDETIEAESLLGVTKLKWDAFKMLRIQDFDTMLEFTYSGALTLPTTQLNNEILDFLKDRFSVHGKKIVTKI